MATAMMAASFASRGVVAAAPALAIMLGADLGTSLVAQAYAHHAAVAVADPDSRGS